VTLGTSDAASLAPWHCPACRGRLDGTSESLSCRGCRRSYPVVSGLPDFRLQVGSGHDLEDDRAKAHALATSGATSPADLVERVFAGRGWSRADVERRTHGIVIGPDRLDRELRAWLAPATSRGPFLDVGCGAGPLLAAAARLGRHGLGVDVRLEWLVVARALIASLGGRPVLAAATAEALPLADASLDGALSLDVIEHVADPRHHLREIDRVVRPGAVLALATPNRFSLAPEPHVNVWGVGWLPRRFQARYATWRSGKPYDGCMLLSQPELHRMLAAETTLAAEFIVPSVPDEELADARGARRLAARLYNAVVGSGPGRALVRPICPFFRVVATKRAG
jgi:SAM-dependent methyltransferase